MVSKLRSQLLSREERSRRQSERRTRIFELVRQLRERQYLTKVRDRAGVLHEAPATVARCLQDFFGGGGDGGGGRGIEECQRYFETLPIPQRVRQAMPLLFGELSADIVVAGLERMKRGSAPGMDGIPAEVYQSMPEVFAPKLHDVMRIFLARGGVPDRLGHVAFKVLTNVCRGGEAGGFAPPGTAKCVPEVDFESNNAPDHRCFAAADSTGGEGFFTGTAHGGPHCVCTVGVGAAPRANYGGSRFSKGV